MAGSAHRQVRCASHLVWEGYLLCLPVFSIAVILIVPVEWHIVAQGRLTAHERSEAMAKKTSTQKGNEYENHVAHLLRALGFTVSQKVRIPGANADMVAMKKLPMGELPILIECKDQIDPIGPDEMKLFNGELLLFKKQYAIGIACFISSCGFTESAREAATTYGIWCITDTDLERSIVDFSAYVEQLEQAYDIQKAGGWLSLRQSYIPQDAFMISNKERRPFSKIFDEWLLSPINCLLVLADYGTGKTAMTRCYSACLASIQA
jgi:hypothetical protein